MKAHYAALPLYSKAKEALRSQICFKRCYSLFFGQNLTVATRLKVSVNTLSEGERISSTAHLKVIFFFFFFFTFWSKPWTISVVQENAKCSVVVPWISRHLRAFLLNIAVSWLKWIKTGERNKEHNILNKHIMIALEMLLTGCCFFNFLEIIRVFS